jgi:serine protease Do
MNEIEKYEQIELYLRDGMNSFDKKSFEEQLKTDSALALEVEQHRKIIAGLKNLDKKTRIKNKLDIFHAELKSEQLKPKGLRRFLNIDNSVLAVAASLALIMALTAIFVTDHVRNKQKAYYTELSIDVDKIKKDQNVILNQIKEDQKTVPEIIPEKYRGTAFAISRDGYLITSYHIIKGAKTIYIENDSNKFKAELVSSYRDMAVLKINDTTFKSFGTLPYSIKSKTTELGEDVFTLGYPREDIVYGEGSVSAATGYEGDTVSFQVSVPVNPGNSGGPLFDAQGNIIGLILGKHSESEAAAFALRSAYIIEALKKADEEKPIAVNKKNSIKYLKRSDQLKKIRNFVFVVKAYN